MGKQQKKKPEEPKVSLPKDPHGLDVNFGDDRLSNTSFTSDSKFDVGYNPNLGTLDEFKAREQSAWGALGNKLGQTVLKVVPGALEQLGYSLDLENAFNENKNNFDNAFSKFMKETKESTDEMLPVYRNKEETFNWSDPKWYIDNIGDITESIGEFALAGAAISAATGGLGAGAISAMRTSQKLKQLTKAGGFVEKGISMTSQGASSIALAHAVGGLQSSEVYKNTYEKAIRKGISIEQAELIAGNSAATTYNHTVISTGLLNATALSPFFKAGRMGKLMPKKQRGQGLDDYINTLKNLSTDVKGTGNKAVRNALGLGRESAQEALEETGELFAQRLGEKQGAEALGEEYEINMLDDEAQLSALLGAVGGFGMKGGTSLVARKTAKAEDEREKTIYKKLLKEKIDALENHARLTGELENDREKLLDPKTNQEDKDKLAKKIEENLEELQANAIINALNEDTEGAIEEELKMYSVMTDEQADTEGLDTDPASPNFFRSVGANTMKMVNKARQIKKELSESNISDVEKEIAGQQKILAGVKEVNLEKAKKRLENKYNEFVGTSDEAILTQSRTYNKLLAYKQLAQNTTNPILKEKYKEQIEVLENQIDTELELLSALSKPVDLDAEQELEFDNKKKIEKATLKKGLNNSEITQLEREAIELESEISILNDTYSQIKNNGDRKQALLDNLQAEKTRKNEIQNTKTQLKGKLESLQDRFSKEALESQDRKTIIESANEAKKSLKEFRKDAKSLPKEDRDNAYELIDKYQEALDNVINREEAKNKQENLKKVAEEREAREVRKDRQAEQQTKEGLEKEKQARLEEVKKEIEELETNPTINSLVGKLVYYNNKPYTVEKEGVRYILTDENTILELQAKPNSKIKNLGIELPIKKDAIAEKYNVQLTSEEKVIVNDVNYTIVNDNKGNVVGVRPDNNPDQILRNEKLLIAVEIARNKSDFNSISKEQTSDESYQEAKDNHIQLETVETVYAQGFDETVSKALDKLYGNKKLNKKEKLALDNWVADAIIELVDINERNPNEIYQNAIDNLELINTLLHTDNRKEYEKQQNSKKTSTSNTSKKRVKEKEARTDKLDETTKVTKQNQEKSRKELLEEELKTVEEEYAQKTKDLAQQERIEKQTIPDAEYKIFIDSGIVADKTIKSIANKVKDNEQLTNRELEIFNDKTAEINQELEKLQKKDTTPKPNNKEEVEKFIEEKSKRIQKLEKQLLGDDKTEKREALFLELSNTKDKKKRKEIEEELDRLERSKLSRIDRINVEREIEALTSQIQKAKERLKEESTQEVDNTSEPFTTPTTVDGIELDTNEEGQDFVDSALQELEDTETEARDDLDYEPEEAETNPKEVINATSKSLDELEQVNTTLTEFKTEKLYTDEAIAKAKEEGRKSYINESGVEYVYEFVLDEDGNKIRNEYNGINVLDFFHTTDGILTINSPNTKVGDRVAVIKEEGYGGFQDISSENVPLNVYRIEDIDNNGLPKRGAKPLTQLPSMFRAKQNKWDAVTDIRKAIDASPFYVEATIGAKNLGDINYLFDNKVSQENSLDTLKTTWIKKGDSWSIQQAEDNPMLGYGTKEGIVIPNKSSLSEYQIQQLEDSGYVVNDKGQMILFGENNFFKGKHITLVPDTTGKLMAVQLMAKRLNHKEATEIFESLDTKLRGNKVDVKKEIHKSHYLGQFIKGNFSPAEIDSFKDNAINYTDDAIYIKNGNTIIKIPIKGDAYLSFLSNDNYKGLSFYNARSFKQDSNLSITPKEAREVLYSMIKSSNKNINADLLNTKTEFEGEQSYYDHIVKEELLKTNVKAGEHVSNATIYLDINNKKEVNKVAETNEKEQQIKDRENVQLLESDKETQNQEKEAKTSKNKGRLTNRKRTPLIGGEDVKYKPYVTGGFEVMSKEEVDWFKETIGENYLTIAQKTDQVKKNGQQAFGYFENAMVTLAEYAKVGTAYHEAFHFVFNLATTAKERKGILNQAKTVYGNNLTDLQLEEKLAVAFEDYKATGELPVARSKGLFDYIISYIKNLIGRPDINNFFDKVNRGTYNKDLIKRNINLISHTKNKLVDGFNNIEQKAVIDAIDWHLINSVDKENLEEELGDTKNVQKILNNINKYYQKRKQEVDDEMFITEDKLKEIPFKDSNVFDYADQNGFEEIENSDLGEEVFEMLEDYLQQSDKSLFFEALLNNWNDKDLGVNRIEGFKTKALKNLRVHGFDVTVNGKEYKGFEETTDENVSDDVREEEDGSEDANSKRIHDVSFTLRSPKKTLSSELKRALSFIPNYKIENGKVKLDKEGKPELNTIKLLGTPTYLPFDRIYNSLSTKLAGTPINEIENKLKEISQKDQSLIGVYNWLVANKNNPIYNKFLSFFDKHNYKYVTLINDRGTPKLVETNRESLHKVIVEDWINNMEDRGIVTYDAKTEEPIINKIDLTESINEFKKNLKGKEFSVAELNTQFNAISNRLGIDIGGTLTKQELQKLTYGRLDLLIDKLKKGLDILGENTILTDLAIEASKYNTDMFNSSFRNGNGDQVYAINLKNSLVETIEELKDKKNLDKYLKDHFYNPSPKRQNMFIKALQQDRHANKLDVFLFDSLKARERGKGKDFSATNVSDSYLADLIAYSAQLENSGYFLMNIGSLSDKPQSYYMRLPKLSSMGSGNTLQAAKKVMIDTMYQEITRMKRANNKNYKLKVKNYRTNEFVYLPFLNDILIEDGKLKYDLTKDEESLVEMRQQATKAIENYLNEQYKAFTESLQENNILDTKNNPVQEYKKLLNNVNLKEFFFNDLVWRQETGKVLMSDLAFYKNKDDYNKRSYQLVTPGTKLNDNTNYNQSFFAEQHKYNTNEYLSSLAKLIDNKIKDSDFEGRLDKDGNFIPTDKKSFNKLPLERQKVINIIAKYKDVNKTDAQSLASLEFYKRILEGTGDWSKDHDYMYNTYWKDGKKVANKDKKLESKLLLQPLKPFRFSTSQEDTGIEGVSQIIPLQIKDSIFPILPIMAARNQGMKEVFDAMQANDVDIYSAADTTKVGLRGANSNLNNAQVHSLKMKDIRLPLTIPTEKSTNLYGTQLGKLILANVKDETNYKLPNGKVINGAKLKQLFNDSWSSRVEDSFNNLQNELGFTYEDGKIDLPKGQDRLKFLEKLRNKLERENESRDLSDNYFDALQIVKDDIYRFSTDMSFPTLSQRYETVILSLFKNEIIKQKFEGYSNVNVADYGIGYDDELKFITNKNGEIVEAEVGMPFELAEKIGLKDTQYSKSGKIRWELLSENQKKALQVIAYRIPTQGKNSMLPVRVVKVMPKSNGSAIMLPGEGTTQGGFDFDVDKTFMMFRQVDKNGNVEEYSTTKENPTQKKLEELKEKLKDSKRYKKQEVEKEINQLLETEGDKLNKDEIDISSLNKAQKDNLIFDLHWAILTSPEHIQEVLTPLDSQNLGKKIKQYEKLGLVNRNDTVHFSSIVEAKNKESLNKYAKTLVGISSLHATGHATMQQLKGKYEINSRINITELQERDFSEILDIKGNLISNNIMEWQNAFLDNAKEPISGYLNANTFTGNVAFTLIRLGLDNSTVTDFINQPIIKELTKEYYKTGSYQKAKSEILFKTGFSKDMLDNEISINDLKEGLTDKNLDNREFQNIVLSVFFDMYKLGIDLSKLNKVLSPDTIKTMISISHINEWENTITHLVNPNSTSTITIDESVFNDDSPIGRIQSFYKYGIKAANDFTKKLFPYNSDGFNKIKNGIANRLGRELKIDEINKINKALYFNLFSDKLGDTSLIIGDKTMVDRLSSLKKRYPTLKNQPIIKALKDSKLNKFSEIVSLKTFNFNSGYKRDSAELNKLINSWQSIIEDSNPEISKFGQDLVKYSMMTSAMGANYGSFIDLVPISYLESSGLNKSYKEMVGMDFSKLEDVNFFADHTADDIIRNYYEDLVPEIEIKQSKIKKGEFNLDYSKSPIEKGFPDYVKVFRPIENAYGNFSKLRSHYALYKLNNIENNQGTYKEINRLGDKNSFLELNKDSAIAESAITRNNTGSRFKSFYSLSEYLEGQQNPQPQERLVGDDLEQRLNQFAASMGITIEAVDNMKAKLGVDAVGAADVINNIIYVAKGEKGLNALPEEISSFFLEAIEGTPLFNQLMREVENTQEYARVLREYEGLYDTLLDYKKEAASKIIADHLINGQKKKGKVATLIDRIWQKLKSLFGQRNPFAISAEQIISDNVSDNLQGTGRQTYYQLDKKKEYNLDNPRTAEDLQAKLVDVLSRKANAYKDRKSFANKFNEKADDLAKLEAIESIIGFKNTADDDYDKIRKAFKEKVQEGKVTFDLVNKVSSYGSAYKVLDEVATFLRNNKIDLPKEVSQSVDFLEEEITAIEGRWATLVKDAQIQEDELVAQLLFKESTDPSKNLEDYRQEVKAIRKDVSSYDYKLSSVGFTTDSMLRVLGELVGDRKRESQIKSIELLRGENGFEKINREYEEWLKSEGVDINDTTKRNEAILEDNQEYFIGEYSEKWQSDIATFYDNRKKIRVEIEKEKDDTKRKSLIQERNQYINKWYKENTKVVSNIKKIVKEKQETLNADEFQDWLSANFKKPKRKDTRFFDVEVNGVKYYAKLGGDLVVPKKQEHFSDKYARIQELKKKDPNHPLVKYYKIVVEDYLKAQENVPSFYRVGRATPGVRKGLMERFTDSKGLFKLSVIKEAGIDNFKRTYDENDRQVTDENGEVVQGIPVRYLKSSIPQGEKSLDVATTSFLAQSSIIEYNELASVHAKVQSIENVLQRRKVYKSKVKGDKDENASKVQKTMIKFRNLLDRNYEIIKDQSGKAIPMNKESNAYKMGKAYIDRIYYGRMKNDEGSFLGMDWGKSVDAILKYTGINALVLNPLQAASNAVVGEIQMLQEAVGGRWFNTDDYWTAKKQIMRETPMMMGDIGNRTNKSKMMRMMEYLNMYDDNIRLIAPELGKDTSKFKSLANTNSLFLFQKFPEFGMQATGILAVLNNVDIKNSKGEKVSLYDVIDIVDGKLQIQEGYESQISEESVKALRKKAFTVNQKIHGIYNDIDSAAIQAMWWGRSVMFFRKWMKPGLDRRFKRGYYNERLGEEDEGNFVSMAKLLTDLHKDFSKFKFKYLLGQVNDIETLTDVQKANVRKGLAEIYTVVSLLFAGLALAGDDDDEENSKFVSFLEYITVRSRTELQGLMGNPLDLWKILKSPSAAMNTISDITGAMTSLITGWEEIERGPNKGMLKVQKNWNDMIPIKSGLQKLNTIPKQTQWLKNGGY